MNKEFYAENRGTLYESVKKNSLVIVFGGCAPKRSNDENYPFYANRNFLYLTGVEQDNTVLMLIGAGEEQEKIASRAKAMGLEQRIRFLGERDDVPEWMQTMDVFAFPSVYEGHPLVLVEAQASGLPCIISDTVSQETDLSGNNIFISLGDMETWKSAVLLNKPSTPDDRRSRSEHNIQKIRENGYDIKTEGRKLKELYDTLL